MDWTHPNEKDLASSGHTIHPQQTPTIEIVHKIKLTFIHQWHIILTTPYQDCYAACDPVAVNWPPPLWTIPACQQNININLCVKHNSTEKTYTAKPLSACNYYEYEVGGKSQSNLTTIHRNFVSQRAESRWKNQIRMGCKLLANYVKPFLSL